MSAHCVGDHHERREDDNDLSGLRDPL